MSWLSRFAARATGRYFEMSYRSLTGSGEGRWLLVAAASSSGLVSHGYSTADDIDELVRSFDDEGGRHLLDIGCGLGHAAIEVHRRTGVAPAIDFALGSADRPPCVGATAAFALDR